MIINWMVAAVAVTAFGIVGTLIYRSGVAGSEIVPPWEEYHKALNDAECVRAQFLRNGLLAAGMSLKDRICYQMRKHHLRFCPLCC